MENLETARTRQIGKAFDEANYTKQLSKGNLLQDIVYKEWMKIWNSAINKMYTADFEVYGEKAKNQENEEVYIFVAVA